MLSFYFLFVRQYPQGTVSFRKIGGLPFDIMENNTSTCRGVTPFPLFFLVSFRGKTQKTGMAVAKTAWKANPPLDRSKKSAWENTNGNSL
jgi:hypothetical protein